MSYLAEVVLARAPLARWEIARDRHKRHFYNNHPVLVSGAGGIHNFLPGFPAVSARAALQGVRESPDDAMAVWARQLIDQLNRTEVEPVEEMEPEPFFEVVDTSDEPGDYNLEINLVRAPSWTLAQLEAWVSPRI